MPSELAGKVLGVQREFPREDRRVTAPSGAGVPRLVRLDSRPAFFFGGERVFGPPRPYNHRLPIRGTEEDPLEPTWHDGLSRKALVELVEGLLFAMDKAVPRLDAIAHHLSLIAQQGEEHEVLGGITEQVADISDEIYAASDREELRDWGNQIDSQEKAH